MSREKFRTSKSLEQVQEERIVRCGGPRFIEGSVSREARIYYDGKLILSVIKYQSETDAELLARVKSKLQIVAIAKQSLPSCRA